MTVNTVNITSGPYTGNDITVNFDYTFRVENKTQLSVYETDDLGVQTLLTVDTDYTVAGLGVDAGGIITRVAGALPTGYTWYIRANYSLSQLSALRSQGGFFPDVHEDALDKLTFLLQQQNDKLNRSFALSDSIDIDGVFTIGDAAADRASKVLGFDVSGDLIVTSDLAPTVSVTPFAETLLDDTTDAAARATLIAAGLQVDNTFTGVNTFTAIQKWAKGVDISSAAALTLGNDGNYFDVTGVTSITSIGAVGIGSVIKLHFDGVLTLTHHATDLVLPGGINIVTSAGDEAEFVEYALGDWRCINYQSAVRSVNQGLIQTTTNVNTSYTSSSTPIPLDDTIPTSTEGGILTNVVIQPVYADSLLVFRFSGLFGVKNDIDALHPVILTLVDLQANAVIAVSASEMVRGVSTDTLCATMVTLDHVESSPGTSAPRDYIIRYGPQTANGTVYINGTSTSRAFGGIAECRLTVSEVRN